MRTLGYLDPGSVSMVASAIAAGIAGVFVFFKTSARRTFAAMSPKRRRMAAEAKSAEDSA
jgi:hypothetical protein